MNWNYRVDWQRIQGVKNPHSSFMEHILILFIFLVLQCNACSVPSFLQLLFNKHSWPDNQGVRWPWNSDLWTRWGAWTDAEAAGFSEQVRGSGRPDWKRWGLCARPWWQSLDEAQYLIQCNGQKFSFETCLSQFDLKFKYYWCLKTPSLSLKSKPTPQSSILHVVLLFNLWCCLCMQDAMEKVLFLWWRWIYSGRFSTTACPVHLGEEYWKPSENPPRDQRRAALGCSSKKTVCYYYVSCHF